MYMGKHLLFILVFADIQKIHAGVDTITKQLIREVAQVTERLSEKNFRLGFDDSNKLPGYEAIYEKLRKYENAEEEGRLVVLPCKVGNMVYVIAPNHRLCEAKHDCDEYDYENYLISWCEKFCPYGYKGIGVIKDIISHIEIRDNGICYCTTNCGYLYDDKVFLTREEAEKTLKEMEWEANG